MVQQRCRLVFRDDSHSSSLRPPFSWIATTRTVPLSSLLRVAWCCTWLVLMALRWMCIFVMLVVQWMVRLARVALRQLIHLSSAPRAHPRAPCTPAVASMHSPSFHQGCHGPPMRCRHVPASALTRTCCAEFMLLSPPPRPAPAQLCTQVGADTITSGGQWIRLPGGRACRGSACQWSLVCRAHVWPLSSQTMTATCPVWPTFGFATSRPRSSAVWHA